MNEWMKPPPFNFWIIGLSAQTVRRKRHKGRWLWRTQMWSWCECTTSQTWMGCRSCGWRRWISSYLFMPLQRLWQGSMALQLHILNPFSTAPRPIASLPDITMSYICRRRKRPVCTTAYTWQIFCSCAGMLTLRKASMFRNSIFYHATV